jgi:hypothetical protein
MCKNVQGGLSKNVKLEKSLICTKCSVFLLTCPGSLLKLDIIMVLRADEAENGL